MDRHWSKVVVIFNWLGNVAGKFFRFHSKLESKKKKKERSSEAFEQQLLRRPGLKSLAFSSKAFAMKDKNTIKSFDPNLIPHLEAIKNELKDDEILMIISKKNLDFVYERKAVERPSSIGDVMNKITKKH